MNNGRMWTIVSPTVGVPIFFIGLAVTSLLVHKLVIVDSAWFKAFVGLGAGS